MLIKLPICLTVLFFNLVVSKYIYLSTEEELIENSEIANMKTYINLKESDSLRFSVINEYLRLHQNKLYLRKPLDREMICARKSQSSRQNNKIMLNSNEECFLHFILIKSDDENTKVMPEIFNIYLTVTDINDNPPQFPESTIEHKIMENSNPSLSDLYLYEAKDPDRLENGTISYKLQYGNSQTHESKKIQQLFRLQISADNIPKLLLLRKLDYEVEKSYQLYLLASDSGNPSKTGTLAIKIYVQDENDNDPHFSQIKYEKTINEDVKVNDNIMEIKAVDKDSGELGRVYYKFDKLLTEQQRLANNYFGIRNYNERGFIYVKHNLDVDENPENGKIEFNLLGCDRGKPEKCSRVVVVIRVLDINDFKPEITVSYFNKKGYNHGGCTIQENTINNYIAMISVTDKDSGAGGDVECTVSDSNFDLNDDVGDGNSMSKMHGFVGSMSSSKSAKTKFYLAKNIKRFDREKSEIIRSQIVCKDNPNYQQAPFVAIQLTSETELVVYISDENDNAPEFVKQNVGNNINSNINYNNNGYSFSIMENRPKSHEEKVRLGELKVIDKDKDSSFTFYLLKNPSNAFDISKFGILYIIRPFDRETMVNNPLNIGVTVSDGKYNTSTFALVSIEDENDMAPVFSMKDYRFSCVENTFSTLIGTVEATDQDSDAFGPVEYRISPLSSFFSIHPHKGVIRSTTRLDREDKDSYIFTVVAVDNTKKHQNHYRSRYSNQQTSTSTVHVQILDVNDNYPRIDFPQPQKTIPIDPLWPVGHKVLTIKASDPDLMENGSLSYKIVKDGLKLFNIDSKSGDLFVSRRLQIGERQIINSHLVIAASDQGRPTPKSTAVSVSVKVAFGSFDSSGNSPDSPTNGESDPYGTQPHIEQDGRNNSGSYGNSKTLIIIVIIALALVVTVVMTVIIVIYQIRLPPSRLGRDGGGHGGSSSISVKRNAGDFNQSNFPNKSDLFYTTSAMTSMTPEDGLMTPMGHRFHSSASTLHRMDKANPLNEYQQLMASPTLMHVWHNNLQTYNEIQPPNPLPQTSNKDSHYKSLPPPKSPPTTHLQHSNNATIINSTQSIPCSNDIPPLTSASASAATTTSVVNNNNNNNTSSFFQPGSAEKSNNNNNNNNKSFNYNNNNNSDEFEYDKNNSSDIKNYLQSSFV